MRPNDFEPRGSLTRRRRRGVASVLSMMFLVIFGSLAAAMAVVASGNVRTADVSLRVSRSTSAAETGLVYGTWILEREASRFVVRKGEIDAEFTADLWNGTYDTSTDGDVIVSPADGYVTSTDPSSLAEAVRDAHLAGDHGEIIEPGDAALPDIDTSGDLLAVRPIRVSAEENAAYFRLRYELVPDEAAIRITSERSKIKNRCIKVGVAPARTILIANKRLISPSIDFYDQPTFFGITSENPAVICLKSEE